MRNSINIGVGSDGMIGGEVLGGDMIGGEMNGEIGTETSTPISMDGLLANWFFVGGVSGAVLILSVIVGLLLAKHKIKKGFDVYED